MPEQFSAIVYKLGINPNWIKRPETLQRNIDKVIASLLNQTS